MKKDEKIPDLMSKNSKYFVKVEKSESGDGKVIKDENGASEIRKFVTFPAMVNVLYSITKNMGNYESCKISVGLTLPCYVEEIDDAYSFVSDWVEEKISKELESIEAEKKLKDEKI